MSTSFFELTNIFHYKSGENQMQPEHTDMHRLTIDLGDAGETKLSLQLSSTLRQKSGIAYMYLSEQDLLRLVGALIENLFSISGKDPQITRSRYSNNINQLDIFSAGKAS